MTCPSVYGMRSNRTSAIPPVIRTKSVPPIVSVNTHARPLGPYSSSPTDC
jgi:hypothetical protein